MPARPKGGRPPGLTGGAVCVLLAPAGWEQPHALELVQVHVLEAVWPWGQGLRERTFEAPPTWAHRAGRGPLPQKQTPQSQIRRLSPLLLEAGQWVPWAGEKGQQLPAPGVLWR